VGVYGVDIYGFGRFGVDPNLVRPDFSVAPFVSDPLDYASLYLTWVKPQAADCITLQLVRNSYNLPQDETDGEILFTQPVGLSLSYTDRTPAAGFNYYSMWGFSNSEQLWIRCTDLIGLCPLNWGYGSKLYYLLPGAYRDSDSALVDPYNPWPVSSPDPPLKRFMSLLGFELDFIRTELESLTSVNDPQHCSGALLPLLAYQFGMPNEPEIGMQQARQLTANAVHLYRLKGSPRGITEFCTIMTSYPMSVLAHHGYNLMLNRDDSVMDGTIGTWQAWPPLPAASPTGPPAVPPYGQPPLSPPLIHFPAPAPPTNTGLKLTQIPNLYTAVSAMTNPCEIIGFVPPADGRGPIYNNTGMRLNVTSAGNIDVCTAGIPVLDFLSSTDLAGSVTFQIQVFSTVSRSVELSLWADNGTGVPIQLGSSATALNTVGDWKQFTVTAPVNSMPQDPLPPAGDGANQAWQSYYWIYPRLRILSAAANENHYVTFAMVWPAQPSKIAPAAGAALPTYDYPRDVKIVISPQYSNLFSNPLTLFAWYNTATSSWVPCGFDGWSAAVDPRNATTSAQSTPISIYTTSAGDPPGVFTVNGTGALMVSPIDQNAVVWGGLVNTFSPAPPLPSGWFTDPNGDWFPQETIGAPTSIRPWVDPVEGWFTMPPGDGSLPSQYFGLGQTPFANGLWFLQAQPPLTNNVNAFQPFPSQPLDFSIYARYMALPNPALNAITLGLRWYFPDGTYVETAETYSGTSGLADAYQRFDVSATTPIEATTGLPAIGVYPFVRFPQAGPGSAFLLNSAMLSPGTAMPPYFDYSMYEGQPDYMVDSHGASYYYRALVPRSERLRAEIYRFLPMGATYTLIFGAGNVQPPLDPTLW
jgi:phage tail-like protein